MAENTITIPVDDFQYYTRRDHDMSRIKKLIDKAKKSNHGMIDVEDLEVFFEEEE